MISIPNGAARIKLHLILRCIRVGYVVYQHKDIDRTHLHIVSVRVAADGCKIDHNNEGRRSKTITEELEREYGLIPAVGSGQEQDAKSPRVVDYKRGEVKT